jgi:hypothetical protein
MEGEEMMAYLSPRRASNQVTVQACDSVEDQFRRISVQADLDFTCLF